MLIPSWYHADQTRQYDSESLGIGGIWKDCVSKLIIIGSDNGLSPCWGQAIIWTNAGLLLIWTPSNKFGEISIFVHFHSRKSIWKCRLDNDGHFIPASMSSLKTWRIFNLTYCIHYGGYHILMAFDAAWCGTNLHLIHQELVRGITSFGPTE